MNKIKIMLVDDHTMVREGLKHALSSEDNIEIVGEASSGSEAIERIYDADPDIILMDMSLPVMDGWEATRLLKQQDDTSHIPIIGLSAHARDADITRGKEAGCDAYETKPLDFPHLVETINNLTSVE